LHKTIKTILPEGIKVVTEYLPHVSSFSLGFWFNVGSIDEDLSNNGISHFIEHMLFKGTAKRSAKKISDDIESCGGYLNAFTSKEHTCFYGRGLPQHLEKTFSVLSDMIQNSLFRNTDICKESKIVIDELYDIEDSPDELIFDKFEGTIFKGSSFSMPIIGTEENIKNFSRDKIVDYYNSHYGFNNLTIVTSGNVEHNDILKYIDKYFKRNLFSDVNQRKYIHHKEKTDYFSFNKDIQQVHFILGKETFGYKQKNRILPGILSGILGEGSSSRLFVRLRERNGIAYQLNTFLNSFYDISTFGVYLSTNANEFYKAYSLILDEFRKLREKKISEKELRRIKEYLKGSIILSLENTTNRMVRIAQSEIYFNRIKTIDEVIGEIESIDVNDIYNFSNKFLIEDSFLKIIISQKDFTFKKAA